MAKVRTLHQLAERQKAEWEQRADRLVAAVAYRMQGDWKPEFANAVKTALWAYEQGEAERPKCPGCAIDGSNALGLHGHLPDCIYNPQRRWDQ